MEFSVWYLDVFKRTMPQVISSRLKIILCCIFVLLHTRCAYFNTFYNAQSYYRQGLKLVTNDTLKVDSELFDKAIEKCAAVIVKYPDSRYVDDAIFMMGASYYYKGDYVRSLEKLEFLTNNFPGSKFYDDAMYYTGLAYYKSEKFNKSIIALKEAEKYKRFRRKAHLVLCYAYYRDGNYRDLRNTANLLMKEKLSRKDRLAMLKILGEAEYSLGDYESALGTYNEIVSLEQDLEQKKKSKLRIASIYLEMNQYDECLRYLESEYDPEFRLLLASLYLRLNKIEEAKQVYAEVRDNRISEYSSRAYYELAQIAEMEDSLELAIAYYDTLATKAAGELLKKATTKSGILKKILDLTNKTEDIDKAQFSLGELYFVDLKDTQKAMAYYENVYKNYPESGLAPKALYANFWISKMILKQDSLAQSLAQELSSRYAGTEYAKSAQRLMNQE